VLGIVGVKIIHRQDVPASADMVARMGGTVRAWEETTHVRSPFSASGGTRATRRQVERYAVHPNEIMTLEPGQAIVLSKLPTAGIERVRVTSPRPMEAARGSPSDPARSSESALPSEPAGPSDPARSSRQTARSPQRDPPTGRGASPPASRHDRSPPRRETPGGRDYPAPGVTR
jgi:hypothetical protein